MSSQDAAALVQTSISPETLLQVRNRRIAETLLMPSAHEIRAAVPHRVAPNPAPSAPKKRAVQPSTPTPKRIRKAAVFAGAAFVIAAAVGILVLGKTLKTPPALPRGPEVSGLSNTGVSSPVDQRGIPTPTTVPVSSSPASPPLPMTPSAPTPRPDSNALSLVVSGTESKNNEKSEPPKTAKRSKESTPKAEVAPSDKNGFLSVNVHPWAEVFVDGESKGTTPIQKLPLTGGPHTVRLENNVLGYVEAHHIVIQSDKALVLTRDAQRKIEASSDE
jgi:serine/threonine-protein kinase